MSRRDFERRRTIQLSRHKEFDDIQDNDSQLFSDNQQLEIAQKIESKDAYQAYMKELDIDESEKITIAHLTIIDNESDGKSSFEIRTGLNIIGRDENADVCLNLISGVSIFHAVIEIFKQDENDENAYLAFIQDVESTNGVYIGTAELRLRPMYNYQIMEDSIITIGPLKARFNFIKSSEADQIHKHSEDEKKNIISLSEESASPAKESSPKMINETQLIPSLSQIPDSNILPSQVSNFLISQMSNAQQQESQNIIDYSTASEEDANDESIHSPLQKAASFELGDETGEEEEEVDMSFNMLDVQATSTQQETVLADFPQAKISRSTENDEVPVFLTSVGAKELIDDIFGDNGTGIPTDSVNAKEVIEAEKSDLVDFVKPKQLNTYKRKSGQHSSASNSSAPRRSTDADHATLQNENVNDTIIDIENETDLQGIFTPENISITGDDVVDVNPFPENNIMEEATVSFSVENVSSVISLSSNDIAKINVDSDEGSSKEETQKQVGAARKAKIKKFQAAREIIQSQIKKTSPITVSASSKSTEIRMSPFIFNNDQILKTSNETPMVLEIPESITNAPTSGKKQTKLHIINEATDKGRDADTVEIDGGDIEPTKKGINEKVDNEVPEDITEHANDAIKIKGKKKRVVREIDVDTDHVMEDSSALEKMENDMKEVSKDTDEVQLPLKKRGRKAKIADSTMEEKNLIVSVDGVPSKPQRSRKKIQVAQKENLVRESIDIIEKSKNRDLEKGDNVKDFFEISSNMIDPLVTEAPIKNVVVPVKTKGRKEKILLQEDTITESFEEKIPAKIQKKSKLTKDVNVLHDKENTEQTIEVPRVASEAPPKKRARAVPTALATPTKLDDRLLDIYNPTDEDVTRKKKVKTTARDSPDPIAFGHTGQLRFLFTGISENDLSGKAKVVSKLGTIVDSWKECTHLITDKPRRTAKYLCVVGSGKPVISMDYFSHVEKGIDAHVISQRKGGMLSNYCVWSSLHSKPPRADMKEIVEACGGQFITSASYKGTKELIVIGCDQDKTACLKFGKTVHSSEFFVSSILAGEFVKGEEYVLFQ